MPVSRRFEGTSLGLSCVFVLINRVRQAALEPMKRILEHKYPRLQQAMEAVSPLPKQAIRTVAALSFLELFSERLILLDARRILRTKCKRCWIGSSRTSKSVQYQSIEIMRFETEC